MTTFFDRDGNPVRILFTHASPFTVTNADTGKSITIPHGAAFHFTPHPDGSQTLVATGFTLEIQFPTDVPAGPSMTLYSGRVVIEISASGTSTVVSTKGKAVDLCAELAA